MTGVLKCDRYMGIQENSLIHLCVEGSTRVTKYLANICKVVSLFASVATGTKVVSLFASVATGTHAHDFAKLFQRTEMKIARAVALLIFQLRCRHECFHNRRCSHSTLVGMLCTCVPALRSLLSRLAASSPVSCQKNRSRV